MKKNALYLLFIFVLIFIAGCKNQVSPKNENINPYFCNVDSDCKVKDVHNCCGYYPRCVNKDYVPDTEAVVKECREKNLVSVCGWAEITQCKCVNNKCNSMQDDKLI